ncbi:MAG TPA: DUF3891 family protein [Candidatus Saccharimonadales bacterium]|nr:DUF3891 family protein [Candidatus Saccharimonadales bacterium]
MQKQRYDRCWLITQPSHAALAGALAARLCAPQFPRPDAQMLQAIALHDSGWGILDAQAVQKSRANRLHHPESFLDMPVTQLTTIWKDSIDTAGSASVAGGYVVSRHFERIARRRVAAGNDSPRDLHPLQAFINTEIQRQKKLAAKQPLSPEELERLTDLLQFVDLVSLYLCCGARENVILPECCGVQAQIANEPEGFRFMPPIVESGTQLTVAALLHPVGTESGREMVFRIG